MFLKEVTPPLFCCPSCHLTSFRPRCMCAELCVRLIAASCTVVTVSSSIPRWTVPTEVNATRELLTDKERDWENKTEKWTLERKKRDGKVEG